MVQAARRVLGVAGIFPPYEGLIKKIKKSENFHEAFTLRPINSKKSQRSIEATHLRAFKPRWGGSLDWKTTLPKGLSDRIENKNDPKRQGLPIEG